MGHGEALAPRPKRYDGRRFLSDLPAEWAKATPAQRNALAQILFQKVEIKDDRVATVVPQSDFAPFFALAENETGWRFLAIPDCQVLSLAGGSDGGRIRTSRTCWAGSVGSQFWTSVSSPHLSYAGHHAVVTCP